MSTLRTMAILVGVLFALFIVVLSISLLRERAFARETAENGAAAAAQVVAATARWTTELSRQALARVDEALGPDIERNVQRTAKMIREAVASLPGNVKTYVVAPDGRTLFSTDPNIRPVDIRDRDYYRAVAEGAPFHVSPLLISRLDGTQIFVFSKRIERDGRFVGAAMISFDVILLRETWAALGIDNKSTVSLIREDGQLVARYPLADGPLDLADYVLFTKHLNAASAGTYPAVSPADGVARIVGYRRVEGTPLIAVASVSTQQAFAQFHRNALITLLLAVPTAIALAGAIILIFRLLHRDEQRRAQLAETLDLNRMLVRDVHHRVKNNLQAIMSLVRLHNLPDDVKTDLQGRIGAMTAVHEHLYRLDQFTEIDATTLIPAIVNAQVASFARKVSVSCDIDPVLLDRDHATPLALVVNEAVTNALKYAFPGGRPGRITVSLKNTDEGITTLVVADDGVGFDPAAVTTGLGGRLLVAMIRQLGGDEPEYSFDGGTRFMARMKLGEQSQTLGDAEAQAGTATLQTA